MYLSLCRSHERSRAWRNQTNNMIFDNLSLTFEVPDSTHMYFFSEADLHRRELP